MYGHFKKALKNCDIFGFDLSFRYGDSSQMKSQMGGLATILTACFGVLVVYYFSQDCIYKTNPVVREAAIFSDNNYVNASTFFYGFYFMDSNLKKLENPERYLAFHAEITEFNQTPKYTQILFSKCDVNKHLRNLIVTKKRLEDRVPFFNESYCLDMPDKFQFLNGDSEIPRISLNVIISECANTTIKNIDYTGKCAPKEEILKMVSYFRVTSFLADSFIDTNDYESPNKGNIRVDSYEFTLDNGCAKVFIYYKNSTTISDAAVLMSSNTYIPLLRISQYIPDAALPTYGYNQLYDIYISADHTNTITYIKYSKIQDILASVGGIIQVFKVTLLFLFYYINQTKCCTKLFMSAYLNNGKLAIYEEDLHSARKKVRVPNHDDSSRTLNVSNPELMKRQRNSVTKEEYIISFGGGKREISCSAEVGEYNVNEEYKPNIPNYDTRKVKNNLLDLKSKPDICEIVQEEKPNVNKGRKITISAGVFSRCCKSELNHKTINFIVEKVSGEMEITNYLRLREEVNFLKMILLSTEDLDNFNNYHDFPSIFNAVTDNSKDTISQFYKYSYIKREKTKKPLTEEIIKSAILKYNLGSKRLS